MKAKPFFRSFPSSGIASSGVLPTMNCRPMLSMFFATTLARRLAADDWGATDLMPHCNAPGKSCPGRVKYSRRWVATACDSPSDGKTSTKRNISTLKASSCMHQSMTFPVQ